MCLDQKLWSSLAYSLFLTISLAPLQRVSGQMLLPLIRMVWVSPFFYNTCCHCSPSPPILLFLNRSLEFQEYRQKTLCLWSQKQCFCTRVWVWWGVGWCGTIKSWFHLSLLTLFVCGALEMCTSWLRGSGALCLAWDVASIFWKTFPGTSAERIVDPGIPMSSSGLIPFLTIIQ